MKLGKEGQPESRKWTQLTFNITGKKGVLGLWAANIWILRPQAGGRYYFHETFYFSCKILKKYVIITYWSSNLQKN